jgi:hypothetical protein
MKYQIDSTKREAVPRVARFGAQAM